ncbi:MAG: DUF4097 family beta strand repeat-containing protein [Cyclobacteriaceae bacterium]
MLKEILITIAAILICTLAQAQTTLAEYHFETEDVQEVTVRAIFCDVNVVQGDKLIFDGIITGSGDEGDYLISSMQSGKTVVFKVEKDKKSKWGWDNIKKAQINLTLPAGVNLTIDNTSGDIEVNRLEGDAHSIGTTSGDMYLRNITGDLSGGSTSGDIDIDGLLGMISIRSTSGDQQYENVDGDISAKATSGDIELQTVTGQVDMETTSGGIELDGVFGALKLRTTSGDINGSDVRLSADSKARTTSGEIELEFINDINEMSFDLDASSGDLTVGRRSGSDRLEITRGGILFVGRSTSGDQSYTN